MEKCVYFTYPPRGSDSPVYFTLFFFFPLFLSLSLLFVVYISAKTFHFRYVYIYERVWIPHNSDSMCFWCSRFIIAIRMVALIFQRSKFTSFKMCHTISRLISFRSHINREAIAKLVEIQFKPSPNITNFLGFGRIRISSHLNHLQIEMKRHIDHKQ